MFFKHIHIGRNNGRCGTSHGLFKQLLTVKAVTDGQYCFRLSWPLLTVKNTAVSQSAYCLGYISFKNSILITHDHDHGLTFRLRIL